MPDTQRGLLWNVLCDPSDDGCRLVLADYLEENGQEERAAFIRVQLELATRLGYAGTEQRRWSDELRRRMRELYQRESDLKITLVEALMAELPFPVVCLVGPASVSHPSAIFRRGFVESISCPLADWTTDNRGRDVCLSQPVTEVRITDKEPVEFDRGWQWPWWDRDRPARIPPNIWWYLVRSVGNHYFPAADAARQALSSVLVALARASARLPPLPGGKP